MRNDELSVRSMDFAVSIIKLVKALKAKHETIISNQIGRSGTSIGVNIREAFLHIASLILLQNCKLHSKNAPKANIG